MLKVNELKGPSCLTAAADDEPLFVLRAHDELAAGIVVEWATAYARSKRAAGLFGVDQRAKYDEALQLAVEMLYWRDTHGHLS